jgi:hypothetical protein
VHAIDLEPGEAVLHEGDPARTVVVLPGVAYFSQAPLLWFAREAALAGGWSVLEVSERAPSDQDPFEWIVDRAESAVGAASATQVVMIGKSLGSAAAPLATKRALPAVWLTPLLTRPEVIAALGATDLPTLVIGSPSDQTWGNGELPENEALEVMELDGLDHSLQIEGDPLGSIDVLREVTEQISDFLQRLD